MNLRFTSRNFWSSPFAAAFAAFRSCIHRVIAPINASSLFNGTYDRTWGFDTSRHPVGCTVPRGFVGNDRSESAPHVGASLRRFVPAAVEPFARLLVNFMF
jgi:hypothetical protein